MSCCTLPLPIWDIETMKLSGVLVHSMGSHCFREWDWLLLAKGSFFRFRVVLPEFSLFAVGGA